MPGMWKTKLAEESSYKRIVRQTKAPHYRQMRRRRGAFLCFEVDCDSGLEFHGEDYRLRRGPADQVQVRPGDNSRCLSRKYTEAVGDDPAAVFSVTKRYQRTSAEKLKIADMR